MRCVSNIGESSRQHLFCTLLITAAVSADTAQPPFLCVSSYTAASQLLRRLQASAAAAPAAATANNSSSKCIINATEQHLPLRLLPLLCLHCTASSSSASSSYSSGLQSSCLRAASSSTRSSSASAQRCVQAAPTRCYCCWHTACTVVRSALHHWSMAVSLELSYCIVAGRSSSSASTISDHTTLLQ
jgi:hypothetical protein